MTKVGNGTLTLTGLNTYTGGTNLNGGILAVNSDSNLGTGPLSFNGGTLEALGSGGGIIKDKSVSLAASGGTFLADAGTASALSGLISGPGAWTKSGPGLLIMSGANTYTGGTIINAGTLQLGNGGTAGSITGNVLNNGILAFNRSDFVTFDGLISGTGALAKLGNGTLALPNSNIYSGGTTISAGTILTQNASALGTGPVSFGNGATLQVQDLLNVNGNWTVSPGTATVVAAGSDIWRLQSWRRRHVDRECQFQRPGRGEHQQQRPRGKQPVYRRWRHQPQWKRCSGCQWSAYVSNRQRQQYLSLIVNNPGTVAAK